MPIYEYYCSDCSSTFSALRPMSQADQSIACQCCDSAATQRVLSLFAVKVAGSTPAVRQSGGCGCGGACGCRH